MNDALRAVLVFVCTFVAEGFWTRWSMMATARRAAPAASYAAGIVAVSAVTTIVYVGQPWFVLPAILGAWCGTYLAVRRG